MTKEALKLALDALNTTESDCGSRAWEREQEAITAIKEALANEALEKMAENARELGLDYEPEQEPVAWEQFYPEMGKPKLAYLLPTESRDNACYTPPQRTWVGLTDEEQVLLWADRSDGPSNAEIKSYYRAIEAKLKEKNS